MRKIIIAWSMAGVATFIFNVYDWHNKTCEWGRPSHLAVDAILMQPLWPIAVYRQLTESSNNAWRCGDPVCGSPENPCVIDMREIQG